MARIGYARVSSQSQSLERQLKALESCSKVFQEKASGKGLNRVALAEMLEYLRSGDIVVITELDRLGRNNKDLTTIMETINSKGATLEITSLPSFSKIEDANLQALLSNLILEIYKYQAENERMKIKERQAQGIALAKQQGKYKGRKKKFESLEHPHIKHAIEQYEKGDCTMKEISDKTNISISTFSRYYKEFKNQEKIL